MQRESWGLLATQWTCVRVCSLAMEVAEVPDSPKQRAVPLLVASTKCSLEHTCPRANH